MTNLPFVSYAQNFEDVMLWRALRDVEHGFYVDVGAYSPREDSVTLAFYERGWSGINIEPTEDAVRLLQVERPRDTNLAVAIGSANTSAILHVFPGTGLSTLNASEAQQRVQHGWEAAPAEVTVRTLASVCEGYVPPGQEIHFLKVDAEGSEREVLTGMDWQRWRPWIVVVEAMRPTTPEPAHDDWEAILVGARYDLAYEDGLNRFYCAEEQARLAQSLRLPPNVFDQFTRVAEWDALQRAARAEAELASVYAGRSWRWTRSFRRMATLWRSLKARRGSSARD